jgi:phosphoglycolate phosphatase-like HAD superfamily hydrolase
MAVPNKPTNDLVISRYLLKHCKLWIWDFDDTLIDTTTYFIKSMEPEDIRKRSIEELDREVPNWRYFKNVVIYLVSSGYKVGIASFGIYEIIRAYMDLIFGFNQQYFTRSNIMASCKEERMRREYVMPTNKNTYIRELMNFYKIQSYDSVVLIDDSATNISAAAAVGMMTVQVGGRNKNELGSYIEFFNEDLMKNIDYKEGITCGGDLYMRNKFSNLGDRKGPLMDKHLGVEDKYIYSDRIYIDQNAQKERESTNKLTDNIKKERLEERQNRVNSYNKWETMINEPFSNIEEVKDCSFCTNVAKDYYIWILLVIFVLFMIFVLKVVIKK